MAGGFTFVNPSEHGSFGPTDCSKIGSILTETVLLARTEATMAIRCQMSLWRPPAEYLAGREFVHDAFAADAIGSAEMVFAVEAWLGFRRP
jgi:hypothetical protein